MNDPSTCVVLVPYREPIDPHVESALDHLERRGYVVRRGGPCTAVDLCRSLMASKALEDGFEELMWIDSDVRFHPDAVERLRSHDDPFNCGIYPKKDRKGFACRFAARGLVYSFGPSGGLVELTHVGMGFTLIRHTVYEDVVRLCSLPLCITATGQRFRPYYLPAVVPGVEYWDYLGEDYAFCDRARAAGHAIWADLSIRLWHVGSYAYTWEDVDGGWSGEKTEGRPLQAGPPDGSDLAFPGKE